MELCTVDMPLPPRGWHADVHAFARYVLRNAEHEFEGIREHMVKMHAGSGAPDEAAVCVVGCIGPVGPGGAVGYGSREEITMERLFESGDMSIDAVRAMLKKLAYELYDPGGMRSEADDEKLRIAFISRHPYYAQENV